MQSCATLTEVSHSQAPTLVEIAFVSILTLGSQTPFLYLLKGKSCVLVYVGSHPLASSLAFSKYTINAY